MDMEWIKPVLMPVQMLRVLSALFLPTNFGFWASELLCRNYGPKTDDTHNESAQIFR
jgi:hypothetical protein